MMTENRQAIGIWRNVVTLTLAAYWITLFISTHIPIDPEFGIPGNDKTLHFVGYGILGALLMLVLLARGNGSRPEAAVVWPVGLWLGLWGLIAVYGAFDELTQSLVGRHCDFKDWLADICGGAIGLTLAWVIWSCIRRRLRMVSGNGNLNSQIRNPKEIRTSQS